MISVVTLGRTLGLLQSISVMNQHVQEALVILNLLFIVLLCYYLEIPTRIGIGSFEFTETEASDLSERHEIPRGLIANNSGIDQNEGLPQHVIDRIKTIVFFLGHARSGHSIVASLMDSHPHMAVSHEVDIFTKLSKGVLAPTKSEISKAVWRNTKNSVIMKYGKRAKNNGGKGYTLFVDGLYQGSYVDYIDVMGDKKAETTTAMLVKQRLPC